MLIVQITIEAEEEHLGVELAKQLTSHISEWIDGVEADGIDIDIRVLTR